ncbi:glycosyltransferase family 4 protein [Francisella philomiragia]|uniref:glycosyltransferase family 4 protein n=1 Tax=Francisella philomiragia TaxID=28110 RepID=UPI0019051839|nr:glycosyltransferase family 4 protein [Francisella philomiragia]MBK2297096.1 glycosyltransferase family 4 protein [Francisella philomiragia]MBK2341342.1 glycosyltransferase family 4 protein [Francisella philomiragia]
MCKNFKDKYEKVIKEQAEYIKELESEIQAIRKSVFWKLYRPFRFMVFLPRRVFSKIFRTVRYRYEISLIEKSGLFDSGFYSQQYLSDRHYDVSPVEHYVKYGVNEGKKPSLNFIFLDLDYINVSRWRSKNPLVNYIEYYASRGVDVSTKLPNVKQLIIKKNIKKDSLIFFTITTKKQLQKALFSRQSIINHVIGARFVIFIIDKATSVEDLSVVDNLLDSDVEILCFDEIRNNVVQESFNSQLWNCSATEMIDIIIPYGLEYFMNYGYENIIYVRQSIIFGESLDLYEIIKLTKKYYLTKSESGMSVDVLIAYNCAQTNELLSKWQSLISRDNSLSAKMYGSIHDISNSFSFSEGRNIFDKRLFSNVDYFYNNNKFDEQPNSSCVFGMNLIGFFDNVIGISQVPKNFCRASLASIVPVSITSYRSYGHPLSTEQERSFFSKFEAENNNYCCNIIFLNPPEMIRYVTHNKQVLVGKKNIGVWWWEFDDYFPYTDAYKYVDELIVFSDFVATALRRAASKDIKIHKLPYPFLADWGQLIDRNSIRASYGIDNDAFVYIYSFDFNSNYERKNPTSLLQAFKNVVEINPEGDNLQLVIKCNDSYNEKYQSLIALIARLGLDEYVKIIKESLSRQELISLFNASDVYVSLHRAEGLGLGMLEAMSLGLPVVATAYGGNLEFMNEGNSFLVDYTMTTVQEDFGAYKAGWQWADPDINLASEYMLLLYQNEDVYREKSINALKYVKNNYNKVDFVKKICDVLR